MNTFNRRRVLKGMLGGSAVGVGLPLLNLFLNGNGNALADGSPMPVRFGTWVWGLGMNDAIFTPKKVGANFDLPEEIQSLAPVQKHINLFTRFNTFKDAAPLMCHHTGWVILRTGMAPTVTQVRPGETIDVTIAKKIGNATRFQTLSATSTGDVRDSYSYESANSVNAPEFSPIRFYQNMFGADYQDPNAAEFKPNPRAMVRKSVLSGVVDETNALMKRAGSEDKERLDQYFTSLRDLEKQFDLQLTRPAPLEACVRVGEVRGEPSAGLDTVKVGERHKVMTKLMAMAVACDQTRVFNMAYAGETAATTKAGYEKPHHTATHEEPTDPKLGYQIEVSWFTRRAMENWAEFVATFAGVKEGDGTLLDNCLIYAMSDISYAKIHSLDNIPMFTAGRAGGKIKTGLHIQGNGEAGTRLGYTMMKVLGLDIPSWGTLSNTTSKEVGEILV
ncbi:MAG: DUF1552 domain-containing protein [Rhodospirillaceae bacterium]|nr:DUF1552 domain-containing protein [Rhodospirillaceae bacterium]